jgi:hypothetical protein
MGGETRKVQCTTLHVCDSNKGKRSKNASIDPGRTSLLDSEDLKVMSTDQERIHDGWLLLADYSRTLTAQEKSFYFYRFHLASRKRIDATRSSELATCCQADRAFQKSIMRKRKANKRVPIFSCMKDDFKWELQRIFLLTPLLISQTLRFRQLIVLQVQYFSSRCNAYACALWCSWCTLEWIGYPYDELVIPKTIKGRGGFEWRVAFSQTRYLACS